VGFCENDDTVAFGTIKGENLLIGK